MTTRLERALQAVRGLPPERQDEVAEALEIMAAQGPARPYTDAENRAIDAGLADAEAGRFATDEEVEDVFRRLRNL